MRRSATALIQRFEFTYDLEHKMLRRALEDAAAEPEEIDRLSYPAGDQTAWRTWREMRDITSDRRTVSPAFDAIIDQNGVALP